MAGREPKAALISVTGLAERFGKSGQAIRIAMNRKGAPEEVPVEGLRATQVFNLAQAVAYLERDRGMKQVGT